MVLLKFVAGKLCEKSLVIVSAPIHTTLQFLVLEISHFFKLYAATNFTLYVAG